uniref:Uncharacterized protein n=1 Tax=Timema douglasi TaxID=61478 RepID=A0A7R8VR91_TIMDO|nr:unnamed protein product [Timema douglasi]
MHRQRMRETVLGETTRPVDSSQYLVYSVRVRVCRNIEGTGRLGYSQIEPLQPEWPGLSRDMPLGRFDLRFRN